jgi:hypothetical protein
MTEQCILIKKDGNQCKGRAKRGFDLCGPHLDIKLGRLHPVNNSPQCKFIKRNGEQCRGKAQRNSKFCGPHQSPF